MIKILPFYAHSTYTHALHFKLKQGDHSNNVVVSQYNDMSLLKGKSRLSWLRLVCDACVHPDCVWGGIEDTSLQISLSCFNAVANNKCPSVLHPQTLLMLSRSISSVLHPVLLPFKLPSWIHSAFFVLLFLFCNLDSVVLESIKKASQLGAQTTSPGLFSPHLKPGQHYGQHAFLRLVSTISIFRSIPIIQGNRWMVGMLIIW